MVLPGGWREFAEYHTLKERDVVVFEVIDGDKLKTYIFR
jgi:hypothetical protein